MTDVSREDADRRGLVLIAAFALARLALSLTLGLGHDEAYTLVMSRKLALSYFDHPPLHQWITHFAAEIFGETLATRSPFVVMFAATGWLLYVLTRDLFSPRAGLIALTALNLTPYFLVSAGEWIVPDGALLFALSAAALALAKLFFGDPDGRRAWALWLIVGLCLGLAGLAKYSAALFALGLLVFLTVSPTQRRWLFHPAPYVAAVLTLLMLLPVLVWNAEHEWASFVFQGVRATVGAKSRPWQAPVMALGEIAYLTPWIFAALAGGLAAAIRAGRSDERKLLLACLALPPILVFTLTPLWGERGIPHWAMPGWFFAFPLLGAWLAEPWAARLRLRRWAGGTTLLLAGLAAIAIFQSRTGAIPLGANGREPTLELMPWTALAEAEPLKAKPSFVVAMNWPEASKVALALGPSTPVILFAMDARGWVAFNDSATRIGQDAVIVTRRERLSEALALAEPYFAKLDGPEPFSLGRGGRAEIELALIRAHGLTRAFPVPYPR